MGDGNVMAQMLSSLTIAFYFFAQFIFGVIFMFTGFSYTGDNFCTLPVNGTLLDDPNKLLGIVEWNKIMGIVLVTIVCTSISVVESYLQKHTSVAKHVIACLSFVTCLGMNYIFGNKVQADCVHSHAGYVTMLIYSWISVLSFSSIGFCLLVIIALISLSKDHYQILLGLS